MSARVRRILFIGLLALGVSPALSAQEGIGRKKQEKAQARKEKVEKKEGVRRDKEGRKRHLSIQDKETRKRITRNTKRAERHGGGAHRDGFLSRLFRRKR